MRQFAILLAAAAATIGGDAAANGNEALNSLSLEDLMNVEIVSASKSIQTASETPAFTTVITRGDIRRYGYRTVAEALEHAAGFYYNTDMAYDYIGVRGFATPGDYNTRVLVLVDGNRINDPIFDYGAVGEDMPIDVEGIERIEVVRGPGSALWGSNALLAVVNVVTRKGGDIEGAEVTAEYGEHRRFKGDGTAGWKLENGVEIAANFSGMRTHGPGRIYYPEYDDPATNNGIADDAAVAHALRGYLAGSYGGFKLLVSGIARNKLDPAAGFGTVFNEPTDLYDRRIQTEASYERNLLPKRNGHLLARLYHTGYYYYGNYLYDYPPLTVDNETTDAKWWGGELRYSMDVCERLNVITGFEFVDNYNMHMRNLDKDPFYKYLDVRADYQMISGYMQGDFKLLEPLRLVAGVRADDHSELHKVQWSPRAALIFSPTQRWLADSVFKLMYGQAFRAPNLYERAYGDTDSGVGLVGNPDLEPEEVSTYELVWEQKVFGNTRMNTSLFFYEYTNIIRQRPNMDGNLEYFNLGTVRSRGVEIELDSRLPSGILGHFGFTAVKTTDVDGRVSNSPNFLLNAGLSLPLMSPRVHLSPEIQFIGDRLDVSGGRVDSSVRLNVTLAAELLKGLSASATAYNLSDSEIFVPARPEHLQRQLPLEGRSYRFQLSYAY